MTGKGFSLFDECAARCVDMVPQEEGGDSKMHPFDNMGNSHRILTLTSESRAIVKIKI